MFPIEARSLASTLISILRTTGPPHSTSPGQTFSLSQLQEREEDVYPAALASASRTNGHIQARNVVGLAASSRRQPAQSPRQPNGTLRESTRTVAAAENDESEPRTARLALSTPIAEQTRRRPHRATSDDSSPARHDDIETPNAVEQSRNAMLSGARASEGGLSKASRRSLAAPSTVGDVTEDDQELDVQYDDQIDESLLQQPDASSPANSIRDSDHERYGDQADEPEQDTAGYNEQAHEDPGEAEQSPLRDQEEGGNESEEASPPPVNRKKGKGKADLKGKATAKRKPLADATNQRKKRTARPDPDEEDENGETAPQKKRSRSANIHREPVHKRKFDRFCVRYGIL